MNNLTPEASSEVTVVEEEAVAGAQPGSTGVTVPLSRPEAAVSTCAPPPRPPVVLLPFGSYIPPSELPSLRRRTTSIPFGLSISPLLIASLNQRLFPDSSTVFYADDVILPDGAPHQLSELSHIFRELARPSTSLAPRSEDESSSALQRRSGAGIERRL